MVEGQVVWWDKSRAFWSKLHSLCLEEEEVWVQSQEHHHREVWRWKHHSLGILLCKGDRIKDRIEWRMDGVVYHKILANNLPSVRALKILEPQRILRSWSGRANLQTWTQSKIFGGSWKSVLPSDCPKTWRIWSRSVWRRAKIPAAVCINLVKNYRTRMISVIANKGFCTKY